jgi:hypothetical protein
MGETPKPSDICEFGQPSAVDLVLEASHVSAGLIERIFGASIKKRHDAWGRQLREVLLAVEQKIGEPAFRNLSQDDQFLSLVLEANQIASRNHDEIKLGALRNAVANAGLSGAPAHELQPLFLRLVDYLTPLHLTTLQVLDDPARWMELKQLDRARWRVGSACAMLHSCIPLFRGRADLSELVVRDLQNAGLVQQGSFMHIPLTGDGALQGRTTDTGRMFVRFISGQNADCARLPLPRE